MVHGKGPEGSPGAGGCPGRAGKGREGSRVLSNAATDVLHEGPEAQGGGLGTRRLAAGEGLPGGRHRLGEHANSSSCLAPSGLRFCGDPPTILRARSASYASEACLGASEDASRPRARVRFECQFEFPSSFRCLRRRELSRAAMTISEKSRRRPTRARSAAPRAMPVKISGRARRCTVWAFAAAGAPLQPSSDVFEQGGCPCAPRAGGTPGIRPAPAAAAHRAPVPDGSGRYPACSTPSSPARGTRTARRPSRPRRTRRPLHRWNV